MEIHKMTHEAYEVIKHLSFLTFFFGSIRITPKRSINEQNSDLGEVPGDNILPKEILISLSSHRVL